MRLARTRLALHDAERVLPRRIGYRLQDRMLVPPRELAGIASGDIEAFNWRVSGKEDRVITLERFSHEDRARVLGAPTGGRRRDHEASPGKRMTVENASIV